MIAAAPRDRAALVDWARDVIAEGSQSFAAASRLFDQTTRERAWLLYSWCRIADDLTDGQMLGHPAQSGLAATCTQDDLKSLTMEALDGEKPVLPPFAALRRVVRETGIPRGFINDHIAGFELDAEGWRPSNVDELLRYCYHVAGSVGCMMAVIMGVDPTEEETLDRACDLGLAFQLVNIARDIVPDAKEGRCYLPGCWLAEYDLAEADIAARDNRHMLAVFARRLVELAWGYRLSARVGAARLPLRSRLAVLSADAVYGAIGEKVIAQGPRAWDDRVHVPAAAKAFLIGRAAVRSMARPPENLRPGLWTRPRQSFPGIGSRS